MDRIQNLIRGTFYISFGQMGIRLIGIVSTPIIVRLLTKSEYGDYSFILSIISLSVVAATFGIPDGIRKHVKEDRAISGWETNIIKFYIMFGAITAIVTSSGLAVIGKFGLLNSVLPDRYDIYIIIAAVIIFFQLIFNITRSVLMAYDDEQFSESLLILIPVISLSLGISLLISGFSLTEFLMAYIVAYVIGLILSTNRMTKFISVSKLITSSSKTIPRIELLQYNSHIYLQTLFAITLTQIDIILLTFLEGSQQVASYKAALVAAQFIWIVPIALQTRLVYTTSNLWSSDKLGEIQKISEQATKLSILISFLLGIVLLVLARQFFTIYFGPKYLSSIFPLYVLVPGAVAFAIARPIIGVEFGTNSLKWPVMATFGAATLNVILNLALIPSFGVIGAATATSISYGVMLLLHLHSSYLLGINPIKNTRWVSVFAITIITAAILSVAVSLLTSIIIKIILIPILGFSIYSFLVFKFNILEWETTINSIR